MLYVVHLILDHLLSSPTDAPEVTASGPPPVFVDAVVELVCTVSGVDPPDTITWTTSNGTELLFQNETSGVNLTVEIFGRSDYGIYNCTAENDFGTAVDSVSILMPGTYYVY